MFPAQSRNVIHTAATLLLAVACVSAADPLEFSRNTRPFLDKYCSRCHRSGTASAGLNLDLFKSPISVQQYRERAGEVIHALEPGIMPFKGQLQPSDSERAAGLALLRNETDIFTFDKNENAGNLSLHLLNRTQ